MASDRHRRSSLAEEAKKIALLTRFVTRVFPGVERELGRWRRFLDRAGDEELRSQGLASIEKKKFHCLGGAVYALMEGAHRDTLRFIVAFQTISDYLDNLCDRTGCLEAAAFRRLHRAFTDALEPEGGISGYYDLFPFKDDGGYLDALVAECRRVLRRLPSYHVVKDAALRLASLYCDLQTYKHTHTALREKYLEEWFAAHRDGCGDLDWWEFAAATGSTLGIFALVAAAGREGLDPAAAGEIAAGYFPWICGLHILLDYLIDQEEDRREGDLNFVFYYPDAERGVQRLSLFLRNALERASGLPDPLFHITVVRGLPAFYLSDPKVRDQGLEETAHRILEAGGEEALRLYRACCGLRRQGKI